MLDSATVLSKQTIERAVMRRVPGAIIVTATPFLDGLGIGVMGNYRGRTYIVTEKAPIGCTHADLVCLTDRMEQNVKAAARNVTVA